MSKEAKVAANVSGDGGAASGEESAGEMIWPAPSFDKPQKFPPVTHARKKRYHSASFSHSGTNGLTIDGIPSDLHTLTAAIHKVQLSSHRLPYSKNSKKSRDGRKIPSKRGGKHDDPTDVLDEIELDPEDPDFDSDEDAPVTFDEVQPTISDEVFEKTFSSLMNEFFIHGKTQDIIYLGRFVARAILDDILPPKFVEIQRSVLSQVPPSGSPPHTNETLGSENSVMPANTRTTQSDAQAQNVTRPGTRNLSDSSSGGSVSVDNSSSGIGSASSLVTVNMIRPDLALQALNRAESILTLRHAFSRLENIWGVPAGPKATKVLAKRIRRLLKSFIDSNDIDEATEALLELDAPHFHHELVFQAIVMAIEISTQLARERVISLLSELCSSVVLTIDQLTLGVRRVYAELPDLQLDVPAAYTLMESIMNDAIKAGFMPRKLANEFTAKPRKRFISETDTVYRTNKTQPW
uniref:Programmed cell death protein 4 n=1 Tax=Trichobilharzia regenti TaxID=157069 RepID=A0AA85J9M3_TRIRE|nr:unnamed protein product [Trichobilharzia regenti]